MAEETMDTGSRSDRKLMQEAGFSEELRARLEQRIAQTSFNAENQRAISEATMPTSAGKGTRDIAAAEPWKGSENLHDAALRMLDDSQKRLRTPSRPPSLGGTVNLRPAPKQGVSAADRLANARDRTSQYAISQHEDMSAEEKEKYRRELKDRFSPGARPMPTSLQGLTSLANERIENAIARGQFKNISRGKGINVERDYNANSPFLDTTEYFMNKIIQKQEIVPPWIEKQQELVKAVATFRGRLRNDWRRHAARLISSSGGSADDQVRRAKAYALAEEIVNPRVRRVENLSSIAPDGSLTSVTVEERIAAGIPAETSESSAATSSGTQAEQAPEVIQIEVTEQPAESAPVATTEPSTSDTTDSPSRPAVDDSAPPMPSSTSSPPRPPQQLQPRPVRPAAHVFRDPAWEKAELAYHTLAVQELNALTRSYNLMAPKIAQKPYYTLDRELKRCFADVAPTLADEILERSRKPFVKINVMPHQEGGVLERFGAGEKYHGHHGRIRDEGHGKEYGFRQFWRDLFGGGGNSKEKEKRREEVV
ncbi:hypothetical protein PV08_06456 [Exophiala spinifera]|uniref:DnaJ homologue subfamily C member 28 conserved domain-containing protein n=1 Tax=Exophiala spinifera TaxID=91928 RepID=A0A0D2BYK8_9EURO|nr:uncharacterized protein PV08_06456 [Exophiala spinifera]KIW16404.1 hypothetical protein PV08_06456 [Exophiala spinifera]